MLNTQYATRMNLVKPSAIRQLLKYGADSSIISFGGGYPDAALFPLDQLNHVFEASILQNGSEALQYTVSTGMPRLREQIASRMKSDGVDCSAENVLILQGGQQGLDLVAKLMVDEGDIIVTEDPTFLGALIAFNPYQPKYVSIKMDDEGMVVHELERELRNGLKIKFVYTIPDFQNPTGVTMSLDRRQELVKLANEFDFLILEDSPYREIRYEGAPVAPLKSLDTEERVIYLGSFSKILAPGLRLGWIVASEELVDRIGLLKLAADTQCSTLNMAAVSMYLDNYNVDTHIASIRAAYLHKKNVMLNAIAETFPSSVQYTKPEGGMFTWLTFPEGFNTETFMIEQAVPVAKVAYVPGATFFPVQPRTNFARVSFATQSDSSIVNGVAALGKLLRTTLQGES